jgi:nucleoside-diphosphate-sugar epimerase
MPDASARVLADAGLSVLVTGAGGFIGAHLLQRLLDAGVRARGWVRARAAEAAPAYRHQYCREVDLCDIDSLRAALREDSPDCVFHLAADAIRREAPHADSRFDNADTTRHLLEALAEQAPGAAVVLASSESVYGPGTGCAFDEATPPAPADAYAVSKLECEQLVQSLWAHAGRRAAIARLSNVYGGGDRHRSRLVPGAILAVLNGLSPTLRSNPAQTRDFLYIDDAVRGLLRIGAGARLAPRGECIFNLASGRSVSIGKLVTDIARIAGRPELAPPVPARLEPLPPRQVTIARVGQACAWAPEFDLHEGLARSVRWYRENFAVFGEP